MPNIIHYAQTEMRTFSEKEFGPVDSLILSQLAYLHYNECVPDLFEKKDFVRLGDLYKAEYFDNLFAKTHYPDNNKELFFAVAASPRYRDIKINYYLSERDTHAQMQFAAITFSPTSDTLYIAYRGTDATIIGWKEDFNMAFAYPLPSQEAGLLYLENVVQLVPECKRITVGGHSKGGNIAVYSAMHCLPETKARVKRVYNHDGPGFLPEVLTQHAYIRVEKILHKTLPESSIIGILLHQQDKFEVVKSLGHGIMQHDPFNWCVENGDFCYLKDLHKDAVRTQNTINEWLSGLSHDERKRFVDTLYGLIESTQAKDYYDLTDDWLKAASRLLSAAKDLDPDLRRFVHSTINELVRISFRNRTQTTIISESFDILDEAEEGRSISISGASNFDVDINLDD